MIPILFPHDATVFTTNGYGRLADIIECTALEERNGRFEVEFKYPLTGVHYSDLQEGNIIVCTHDDTKVKQPFRIYRKSAPMNGIVTFNARHICYGLRNVIVRPFTGNSCADTLAAFSRENMTDNPFNFWTDKTVDGTFNLKHPASVWSLLGGSEGSVLDVYGTGEWKFDNWDCKLYLHRGTDSGVTIRYGKNLTDIEHTVDGENTFNAIVAYWDGETGCVYGDIVGTSDAPLKMADWTTDQNVNITDDDNEDLEFALREFNVAALDFTEKFESQPTVQQLNDAAAAYLSNNTPWIPSENIKVDFIALWQTTEYKDYAALQQVRLCDTVTVLYPALGVEATAKVIKTVYNVLLDRYDQIEVGKASASFGDTILAESMQFTKEETGSALSEAQDYMTNLIRGGFGGNVVTVTDANGRPTEMLFMDTDNVDTAVHVLRINKNGIGFSSHGVEGPFHSAWTLDGRFNCDWLYSGSINANLIKTGTLDGQYFNCINLNAVDATISGKLTAKEDDDNYVLVDAGHLNAVADGENSLKIGSYLSQGGTPGNAIQLFDGDGNLRGFLYTNTGSGVTGLAFYDTNGQRSISLYNAPGGGRDSYLRMYDTDSPDDTYMVLSPYGIWFYDPSSPQVYGIAAMITAANGIFTAGDLIVSGSKNRVVKGHLLYAEESAEPFFSDIGEGQIGENGKCVIKIDPAFKTTVDLDGYQVFLTKYSDGDYWIERQKTQFTVHGTPGLKFGWELKAHQFDHNGKRLEEYNIENNGNR